ncbi:ABC transporter permease [Bosea sp. 2KB_26]|uniref:ABC transporter permease n=1 Tax=Bosea sp. 2KB_26 TaxID=3237475 RepID=UPI003F92EBA9
MNFDFNLILSSLPQIAAGLGITLKLMAYSTAIGLVLAVLILLMRISGRWYLAWPAMGYIYFLRGTPILVQIFIIYHGLPQLDFVRESVLWPVLREPFGCCVVALSLNSSAYISEILRGGVLGVDKGVNEAARALGLSAPQRFIYIVTPIAVRLALPAYSNEFISMMKATALASTVTLLDITGVARTIVSNTFAPFEIFIAAALIYLAMAWVFQVGFGKLEDYLGKYTKRGASA